MSSPLQLCSWDTQPSDHHFWEAPPSVAKTKSNKLSVPIKTCSHLSTLVKTSINTIRRFFSTGLHHSGAGKVAEGWLEEFSVKEEVSIHSRSKHFLKIRSTRKTANASVLGYLSSVLVKVILPRRMGQMSPSKSSKKEAEGKLMFSYQRQFETSESGVYFKHDF